MKLKKIIAVTMVCAMILPMSACGSGKDTSPVESVAVSSIANSSVIPEVTSNQEEEMISSEDEEKKEVETAVGEFQYACQTSDVDAMIDCLDPGFAQAMKSGRLLLNWMSTSKSADEVVMDTLLISIMNISDISVDLSTMEIEIREIKLNGNMATISAIMSMESTPEPYRDDITLRMTKDSDKWYITGVTN